MRNFVENLARCLANLPTSHLKNNFYWLVLMSVLLTSVHVSLTAQTIASAAEISSTVKPFSAQVLPQNGPTNLNICETTQAPADWQGGAC